MTTDLAKTGQSRVFTIEDRAGPGHAPVYQTLARAAGADWPGGDVTLVRVPDPDRYDQYIVVDELVGEDGDPSLSLEVMRTRALSEFLKLKRKRCPIDIQLHIGACQNPSDFNGGWDIIMVLEAARFTSWGTGDLGAFNAENAGNVIETLPVTGRDLYEIGRVGGAEIAASNIVQEIIAVTIADARTCGDCGDTSDGCQKMFAVTSSAGGSPGLPAEVIYSDDGGTTIGESSVTTLGAAEDPTDILAVGAYIVVLTNEGLGVHYVLAADLLAGTGTWAESAVGFVVAKGPNAGFSLGQSFTWIVGDGGYIYFSSDITGGVTVQNAGVATVQNLAAIHGTDKLNLVAVGAANVVVVTTNGGDTWSLKTGPAVGVALTSVWMKDANVWFVGTAGGKLYYTRDGGASWTEKTFPNSGSGAVRAINFSTPTVGWMAHDYTPVGGVTGRVLRTVDGGQSWYVIPENRNASFPTNDRINDIAGCGDDVNVAFAGGLGANAIDGILVKVN